MNANRLINMVLRLVMRKGVAHLSKGQTSEQSKQARQTARRMRQTQRLTRRL
jgi:hypothetical protein